MEFTELAQNTKSYSEKLRFRVPLFRWQIFGQTTGPFASYTHQLPCIRPSFSRYWWLVLTIHKKIHDKYNSGAQNYLHWFRCKLQVLCCPTLQLQKICTKQVSHREKTQYQPLIQRNFFSSSYSCTISIHELLL